jgi:hypothetical protein
MMNWNELGRPDQKALQCLYGGGSLRNGDPDTILRLRRWGLIEGKNGRERLSSLGWQLMDSTHAEMKARMGLTGFDRRSP